MAIPPRDEFPTLLRSFRERVGRSRNSLANEVGVDPSYLTRIEHGDRTPPREHILEAIARALHLDITERNRLLTSAGHVTHSVAQLGRWDPALQAVVDVLNDTHLSPEQREEFSTTICNIANAYRSATLVAITRHNGYVK